MNKEKKYLVLDFGKVLAYPTTGHWFITPMLKSIAKDKNINLETLANAMASYSPILSRKITTLDEEETMFYDYYVDAFNKSNNKIDDETLHLLAKDITYNDDKYGFYDCVHDELETLSKDYKIIMLSDNWPCSFRIMENAGLDKYFDKLYVSSVYGVTKKDKLFFDYPINDFDIKDGEAIFVDDNEELLHIAKEKGFDVRLMNRDKEDIKSDYKVITNLLEL